MEAIALKNLSIEELDHWLADLGEPAYRCRQIKSWIYARGAEDFESMTDLPRSLRTHLAERARLVSAEAVLGTRSRADGSIKYLFRLGDGETVEAVHMSGERHPTFCVSTQVGCPLDCVFCETGRWGFKRNLAQDEILDQILQLRSMLPDGAPRPNIVFMGMGEPLLNLPSLVGALRVLNHPDGLACGGRRITVSTAGLPRQIRALAASPVKAGLALSLNAAEDRLRAALMPAAGQHPIAELLAACEDYATRTKRRVTLEYVLFAGVNDRNADAASLRELTRGRPFKLNLIPYNPGDAALRLRLPGLAEEAELRRPGPEAIERFVGRLVPAVPSVTVRWSQGADVGGGCGQLRGRSLDPPAVS